MPRTHFRLADASDRELLALLQDAADNDGQASTADVADLTGLKSKRPLVNVGVRLGYLRTIGLVERDPETRGWYLTATGESLVAGRLSAAARRALDDLDGGAAWAATEQLGELLRIAGVQQATLMRRQWQHSWLRRNGRGGR
jgi:hypothetical protein